MNGTNGSVSSCRRSHSAQQKKSSEVGVSCWRVSIQHFPAPKQETARLARRWGWTGHWQPSLAIAPCVFGPFHSSTAVAVIFYLVLNKEAVTLREGAGAQRGWRPGPVTQQCSKSVLAPSWMIFSAPGLNREPPLPSSVPCRLSCRVNAICDLLQTVSHSTLSKCETQMVLVPHKQSPSCTQHSQHEWWDF